MDKVFAWETGQVKLSVFEIENTEQGSKGILCFKNIFLIIEIVKSSEIRENSIMYPHIPIIQLLTSCQSCFILALFVLL